MRKTLFAFMRLSASYLITVAIVLSANLAAAHADTFSFTPDNGATYNFSLDPSQINFTNFDPNAGVPYSPVTVGAQTDAEVIFYIPSVLEGEGNGPIDFGIDVQYPGEGFNLYFGPQLFSGSVYNPTFIPGSYTLEISQDRSYSATLIIDGPPSTVTPEPSTFTLLGTGILGMAAMHRKLRILKT
jgi:PEP-CTERM motif